MYTQTEFFFLNDQMNNNKWRTETLFLKQYCGHHDLSQLFFADGIKFMLKHAWKRKNGKGEKTMLLFL